MAVQVVMPNVSSEASVEIFEAENFKPEFESEARMVGEMEKAVTSSTVLLSTVPIPYIQTPILNPAYDTWQVLLYDDCGKLFDHRFLKNYEKIESGETLEFDKALVDVGDAIDKESCFSDRNKSNEDVLKNHDFLLYRWLSSLFQLLFEKSVTEERIHRIGQNPAVYKEISCYMTARINDLIDAVEVEAEVNATRNEKLQQEPW